MFMRCGESPATWAPTIAEPGQRCQPRKKSRTDKPRSGSYAEPFAQRISVTALEAPHESDEAALNCDPVRAEDPCLIGRVGRLERDRVTFTAQPLQGHLVAIDEGDDD